MGREYVIDHVLAFLSHEGKTERYKAYLSEAVRLVGENVAKIVGGAYLQKSWDDIENPKAKDERTGDEIAAEVIRNAGLTLKGENSDG